MKKSSSDDNGGNHKRHTSQNGAFREIEIIIVLEFDCSFPTFRLSIHHFFKRTVIKKHILTANYSIIGGFFGRMSRLSGIFIIVLNTLKNTVFFPRVDIANHLLIRHSPLAPLGQVDE